MKVVYSVAEQEAYMKGCEVQLFAATSPKSMVQEPPCINHFLDRLAPSQTKSE